MSQYFLICTVCLLLVSGCGSVPVQYQHTQRQPVQQSPTPPQSTYVEPSGLRFTCIAPNRLTGQQVVVIGQNGYANGSWADISQNYDGWPVIIFDVNMLKRHPWIFTRFQYFNQCARLSNPTYVAIQTSCLAVREMRYGNYISAEQERTIRDIYYNVGAMHQSIGGSGWAFWNLIEDCTG